MAVRLIDVHCNWLRQYAPETTTLDPPESAELAARLKQLSGYMTATSAAILSCARSKSDWERQPDPCRSLGDLIARYEAEFSGRLLIGQTDLARWASDPPDGLTWAMLAVSGLDHLVREPADLKVIHILFKRGVRTFQLVESNRSLLAGSADPGDDRGLTELGRSCLAEITTLQRVHPGAGVPILDLSHLNSQSMANVLDAVDDAARNRRVLLMYSHGALAHAGFDGPHAIDLKNISRLRDLRGLIGLTPGPPFYQSAADFKSAIDHVATIPFEGRLGYEGIAIGTDFLERDAALPELADASAIVEWISSSFDETTAELLLDANARQFLTSSLDQY